MINRRNILALAAGSLLIPSFSFGAEKKIKYELVEIELDKSIIRVGNVYLPKPTLSKKEAFEKINAYWYDQEGFVYLISYKDLSDKYNLIFSHQRLFIDGEIIEGLKVSNIYCDDNFADKDSFYRETDEAYLRSEKHERYLRWKNIKLVNRTPNYEYQELLKNNFNWSEWENILVFNYKDGIRFMNTFGRKSS